MNGDKESPESNEATTPTPSAPSAPSTSKQKQPIRVFSTEGCCNCGAKESELWRTKTMKDGTKKKVCNGKLEAHGQVVIRANDSVRFVLQ